MVSLPASHPPSDYDERSHLHDEFTQMTVSLQEVAAVQGECFVSSEGISESSSGERDL